MAKDIDNKIGKIDNRLEKLTYNAVLDVADLTESEANGLIENYKRDYFVRGPQKDDKNSSCGNPRYVIAIQNKYSIQSKNA